MVNLVPIVPQAVADQFAEQMKQPDLVFLTRENEKRILDQAHQAGCTHAWTLKLSEGGKRERLCENCGLIDTDPLTVAELGQKP